MGCSRIVYWVVGAKIPSSEKMRVETILMMKNIPYKVKTYVDSSFIVLAAEEFDLGYFQESVLEDVSIEKKEKFRSVLCEANLDYRLNTYLVYECSH